MPSFFAVVELAASRWLKVSVVVESLLATWRVVIFEHLVTIWLFLVFSSEGDAATALRCRCSQRGSDDACLLQQQVGRRRLDDGGNLVDL